MCPRLCRKIAEAQLPFFRGDYFYVSYKKLLKAIIQYFKQSFLIIKIV